MNNAITPIRVALTDPNPSKSDGAFWTSAPPHLKRLIQLTVQGEGVSFLIHDPQSPQIRLETEHNILFLSPSVDEINVLDNLELVYGQMHQSNPTPLPFLDMVKMFDEIRAINHDEEGFVVLKRVLESTQLDPFFEGNDWSGWSFSKGDKRDFTDCHREEMAVASILTNVHPLALRLWIDTKESNRIQSGVSQLEMVIGSVESWMGYHRFYRETRDKLKGVVQDGGLKPTITLIDWSGEKCSPKEILCMNSSRWFIDLSNLDHGRVYSGIGYKLEQGGFGHILKKETI